MIQTLFIQAYTGWHNHYKGALYIKRYNTNLKSTNNYQGADNNFKTIMATNARWMYVLGPESSNKPGGGTYLKISALFEGGGGLLEKGGAYFKNIFDGQRQNYTMSMCPWSVKC